MRHKAFESQRQLHIEEMKMADLEGKIAIVTGAGRGIGKGTALKLATSGAKLVLAGIGEENIGNVKREIVKMGGEAITVRTDVSKWADAQRLASAAMTEFGRIDILVNNAGIHPQNEQNLRFGTLEISDSDWDFVIDTNLKGPFNVSKAVIPHMVNQRYGRIVNVSSVTGLTGKVGSVSYCASKAGIMALTKVMAGEFGEYNITINCVAPGLTMTDMNGHLPPDVLAGFIASMPLRRAGQPSDIAAAILWFLGDEVFATGQTLVVDGGSTMH
jgi:3-oxoacyl-[acyl-carrier protein] reductase